MYLETLKQLVKVAVKIQILLHPHVMDARNAIVGKEGDD
jgi:hypothetical protein